MDPPRRPARPPPHTAPEQAHHEPALTGHVSQLDGTRQHQRTASPSESAPVRSFNLDFPTLNDDGSVSDITAHQTSRYPPTPPAALSSLGARSKMDRRDNVSESEQSFADSQYDMIDDLSEISTDDHDTASLASNGDDGQLTPDDAGSDAGVEDSTLFEDDARASTQSYTAASYVNVHGQRGSSSSTRTLTSNAKQQIQAENDLLDSYMSEDLETPRQSVMPNAFSSTWYRPKSKAADLPSGSQTTTTNSDDEMHRILFISEHDVVQVEMDEICSKIAASMHSTQDASSSRVVRLPAPPSGIELPTATAVYGRDTISATLQHCIGAELRSPGSFKLRVLDFDGEHTSFFTVGKDAKVDLIKPDIAVFYVTNTEAHGNYSTWLDTAFEAIDTLNVPMVVILDPYLNAKASKLWSKRCMKAKAETHVYTNADEFLRSDVGTLFDVSKLLPKDRASPKASSKTKAKVKANEKRPTDVSWLKLLLMFFTAAVPYLLIAFIRSSTGPVCDIAVRREALSVALEKIDIPPTGVGAANIEHLLPAPDAACLPVKDFFGGVRISEDCKQDPRNQGLAPNHIIVSLPTLPRTPQLLWAQVEKSDGRQLAFNQTKLIDGVWSITFDPEEAYGTISVNMITQKPYMKIDVSHNFGSRMLQRKTYEKAGTDVSKVVGKDVAVMRDAAQTLSSKLSTEVGAGMSATKNMTNQLAVYMARDLQVIGNTAVSIFGKVANASNQAATAWSKDFVLMQRDLVKFTKDLSTKVRSSMDSARSSSKALIKNPLALSRGRVQGIKDAFARKKAKGGEIAGPCGRRSLKDRLGSFKSDNALSIVPESAAPSVTNHVDYVSQKTKFKKAVQQLEALTKRVKRQEMASSEKMSKPDLHKLKKDVKRQEKLVKKMRADMQVQP